MAERFEIAHLVDPTHKLPIPGTARFFSDAAAGERIDTFDPFWIGRLNDKSVALGPRPETPKANPSVVAPPPASAPAAKPV